MNTNSTVMKSVTRTLPLALALLAALSFGLRQISERTTLFSAAAQQQVAVVNAASFGTQFADDTLKRTLAPDSIAAAFGNFVTQNSQVFTATTQPLPTTLGGVRVTIGGQAAGLFFVAPTQINLLIPAGVTDSPTGGTTTVTVTNSDNSTRTGTITIRRSAPGIFTFRANGSGVASALATFDGVTYTTAFNNDGTERELNPGTPDRKNILVLYGTGLRNVQGTGINPGDSNGVAEGITLTMQGIPLRVNFAGPVQGFSGLDQINAQIPPEAAGMKVVRLRISTKNQQETNFYLSNEPTASIGGTEPPIKVTTAGLTDTINGELGLDDQIQRTNDGKAFFFDAYSFTTTQNNTTLAVDLRSPRPDQTGSRVFDAALYLYRVTASSSLEQISFDDQSGGYGNNNTVNNNALLLTVIPTPGRYVIFVTSSDFEPGGYGTYQLKFSNNVIQQINYGANINGAIATTDIQTSGGDYLDAYWFQAAANDNADIVMRSTALDSFLILQANDGSINPPLSDDNSGGGRDARLTQRLSAAGIYIIIAFPYAPNVTGAYTLALNRVGGFTGVEELLQNVVKAPGRELGDAQRMARPATQRAVERTISEQ